MSENLSNLKASDYETKHQGKDVKLIVLHNKKGAEVCLSNLGGNVISFMVPDKEGKLRDIVVGYQNVSDMINHSDRFLGAAVGRYANRIGYGKFKLDGKEYNLPVNNGPHTLHTGPSGFHNNVWDILKQTENLVQLKYIHKDGIDGYPGNLETILTYELTDENELLITYDATTDKATPCSFTNHAFFNLTSAEEDVYDTELQIFADFFTPIDENTLPTGEILSVANTVFDFRNPRKIGEHIDDKDQQIVNGAGYDHNYCIKKDYYGEYVLAARAYNPRSGIALEVRTTTPGIQFYSANWMEGFAEKHGIQCYRRHAFCLEPGMYANSPNYSHFPNCILRPGEKLHQVIGYKALVQ